MHFYTSKDSFNSSVGVDSIVELTKDQARRRAHAIESVGDNLYKVLKTIYFKEGEVFGVEQKLGSKLHRNLFDDFKSKDLYALLIKVNHTWYVKEFTHEHNYIKEIKI